MPRTCETEQVITLQDPTFKGLDDTPNDYAGQAGKVVAVNSTEDGVEFVTGGSGGSTTFTGLDDTPANYTGQGTKKVVVKSDETGLEFIDDTTGGSLDELTSTNTITSITVGSTSKQYLISNIDADGFENGMTVVGETSGTKGVIYSINSTRFVVYNNQSDGDFVVGEKIIKKVYPINLTDIENVQEPSTTSENKILQLVENLDGKLEYQHIDFVSVEKVISTNTIISIVSDSEIAIIGAENDGFVVGESIVGLDSGATGILTDVSTANRLFIDGSTKIGTFTTGEKVVTFRSTFRLGDLSDVPTNDNTFADKFLVMGSDGVTHQYTDQTSQYKRRYKALSIVDQVLTNDVNGTILVVEVEEFSKDITVSNGEVTFNKAGFYNFEAEYNINPTTNTVVEIWFEEYNGVTWNIIPNSGIIKNFSNADEGLFSYSSLIEIDTDGKKIRSRARVDAGNATLEADTLNNGTVVPSLRLSLFEI